MKINGDTNQPTNRQGKYRAICLFEGWKIEGRDLQYQRKKFPQRVRLLETLLAILTFIYCAEGCAKQIIT